MAARASASSGDPRQIGKDVGDRSRHHRPRRIEASCRVPADLAEALRAATLRKSFDALSYSHQREYVMWIDEAKRGETVRARVAQTVERLKS